VSGLLLLLLFGLVAFVALVTWWTAFRLRRPPRRTDAYAVSKGVPANPSELIPSVEYEERTIELRDGRGRAYDAPLWSIPGRDPEGPVCIATPGWGDSRLGILPRLGTLLPVCAEVHAWDSPGSGTGPGLCSLGTREPSLLLDLVRKLRESGVPQNDVALLGWSMGAGVAIAAAARAGEADRIGAVIAESPYRHSWTPASNVLRLAGYPHRLNVPLAYALLGWRFGVGARWKGFDRESLAKRLKCSLLVIHGDHDEICPIEDGRAIARSATRSMLVIVDGAGHNDLWTDDRFRPSTASAVRDFLLSLSAPTGPPAAPAPV